MKTVLNDAVVAGEGVMASGFMLRETLDHLCIYAEATDELNGDVVPADQLADALSRMGVGQERDTALLQKLSEHGSKVTAGSKFPLVQGRPPQDGRDGKIEFLIEISGQHHYQEQQDGSLDFREANTVMTVEPGGEIARIHPATSGQDGVDVYGNNIPAQPGQPAVIKPGDGVKLEESDEGMVIVAEAAGRPRCDGENIWVDRILTVTGDVDYETGNIRFPGTVQISGNILTGFSVEADGDIIVGGTVGASELKSGGDITIRSGINGQHKAIIKARGSINAKYLNEAEVHALKNISFETESVNSSIFVKGMLDSPRATLIGGRAVVRGNVDIGTLGSDLGIPTRLDFGRDYKLLRKLETCETRLKEIEAELPDLARTLERFSDRKKFLALDDAEKKAVQDKFAKFKELKQNKQQLSEERNELNRKMRELARGTVVLVREKINPDVSLFGLESRRENREELIGPLEFYEDRASERVMSRKP